jgi:hypothetical protein
VAVEKDEFEIKVKFEGHLVSVAGVSLGVPFSCPQRARAWGCDAPSRAAEASTGRHYTTSLTDSTPVPDGNSSMCLGFAFWSGRSFTYLCSPPLVSRKSVQPCLMPYSS